MHENDPDDAIPGASELRQVNVLLEGLRAMGSGRILDEVLAIVLDAAINLAGAERGCIMLAEGDRLVPTLARSSTRETLAADTIVTSRVLPRAAFDTGQVQLRTDLQTEEHAGRHLQTLLAGIRAAICLPCKLATWDDDSHARGAVKTIGVLYLDSGRRARFMSPDNRAVLEALAGEAAVAIENARLYRDALERARLDDDLRRAVEMQAALLPENSFADDRIEVFAHATPCRAVGGDFFEHGSLERGRHVFAVADVSGKGVPAALLAAQTLGMFRARSDKIDGPAEALTRVNRALARRDVNASFVTMVCAVLAADDTLSACNAGHNPPLVLRSDRRVDSLGAGGTVLGLFPDARFDEESTLLHAGETLVLYSDGITEAANLAGERFGDARLSSALCAADASSPRALVGCVLAAVEDFVDGALAADDMTILAVRRRG